MAGDPRFFFIPQILFFVAGSVLFGCFVQTLHQEIGKAGWVLSTRIVWFGCLCSSSFIFCVLQLDPYCVLELFSCATGQFLAWWDVVLLLNSVGAAMYLYVDVIYRQHLSRVPPALTYTWIFSNGLATFLVLVFAALGAAENSVFWLGVCGIVVVIQEFVLLVGFLVSAHKVARIIDNLESRARFGGQLRKLLILRVAAAVVLPAAMINQLVGGESLVVRLAQWGQPVNQDSLFFDFNLVVPDALTVIAHAFLLYAVRPSYSSNERPSRQSGTSNSAV